MLLLGQQHVILHVEDARGVVGALQMQAEPREPVGVVAQHGAVGRAVEPQRGFLHEAQELRQFLAGAGALAPDFLQLDPGRVDGVPHLDVSAVRTERELSRAFSMQLRIEEGLPGANDRYSTTFCSLAS